MSVVIYLALAMIIMVGFALLGQSTIVGIFMMLAGIAGIMWKAKLLKAPSGDSQNVFQKFKISGKTVLIVLGVLFLVVLILKGNIIVIGLIAIVLGIPLLLRFKSKDPNSLISQKGEELIDRTIALDIKNGNIRKRVINNKYKEIKLDNKAKLKNKILGFCFNIDPVKLNEQEINIAKEKEGLLQTENKISGRYERKHRDDLDEADEDYQYDSLKGLNENDKFENPFENESESYLNSHRAKKNLREPNLIPKLDEYGNIMRDGNGKIIFTTDPYCVPYTDNTGRPFYNENGYKLYKKFVTTANGDYTYDHNGNPVFDVISAEDVKQYDDNERDLNRINTTPKKKPNNINRVNLVYDEATSYIVDTYTGDVVDPMSHIGEKVKYGKDSYILGESNGECTLIPDENDNVTQDVATAPIYDLYVSAEDVNIYGNGRRKEKNIIYKDDCIQLGLIYNEELDKIKEINKVKMNSV